MKNYPLPNITRVDQKILPEIRRKIDLKTKPPGSLGTIEELAEKIALIQQNLQPTITAPLIAVVAGDHGVVAEKVSPYPQEVTAQMVLNFLNGGAAINIFARTSGIALEVIDAGVNHNFGGIPGLIDAKVNYGTKNFCKQPAMTAEESINAMEAGGRLVSGWSAKGCNLIGFGEMGIGNTTSAAAVMAAITGYPVEDCAGAGTGLDATGISNKVKIVESALGLHQLTNTDPLEILAKVGGFEIALICGAMLKAASLKMLILVDGFITTAALMLAHKLAPAILDYCLFTHCSAEKGHQKMMKYLEVKPILNLDLRLGEGTGAALAFPLVKSAVNMLNEMASFEEAKVTNRKS